MSEARALIPLHRLMSQASERIGPLCHDGERFISWQQFSHAVSAHAQRFIHEPAHFWLLGERDIYAFVCLLFALLHAGKEIVIPPNNQPGTIERLRAQGCFESIAAMSDSDDCSEAVASSPLPALDAQYPALHLYTSGSSGAPKRVSKSLAQFEAEIEVLESMWGAQLGNDCIVGTVPHHHIYGLLFRLLWPMAAGRCIDIPLCSTPDLLLARLRALGPSTLIASPAQLSRLPELIDLSSLKPLSKTIFCSGGPLPPAIATMLANALGHAPVEIYGSTETGGIAWRRQDRDSAWAPLPTLQVQRDEQGALLLRSPFLPSKEDAQPWHTDDAIELLDDGRFHLRGRLDRIVKIEEKRVSLPDMEAQLMRHEYIAEAALTALSGRRQYLAAVVVLSATGRAALNQSGRQTMVHALRQHLAQYFEAPLLPRRWRFVLQLPLSERGKLSQAALKALFQPESDPMSLLPEVLSRDIVGHRGEWRLRIDAGLEYFAGHFPAFAILPGVVQIDWAIRFAREAFNIRNEFVALDAVKFQSLLKPDALSMLRIEWDAEQARLSFCYEDNNSAPRKFSSGRVLFKAAA